MEAIYTGWTGSCGSPNVLKFLNYTHLWLHRLNDPAQFCPPPNIFPSQQVAVQVSSVLTHTQRLWLLIVAIWCRPFFIRQNSLLSLETEKIYLSDLHNSLVSILSGFSDLFFCCSFGWCNISLPGEQGCWFLGFVESKTLTCVTGQNLWWGPDTKRMNKCFFPWSMKVWGESIF